MLGQTLRDNVCQWGYNIAASGGRLNTSEHSLAMVWESRFRKAGPVDQCEWYLNYVSANGLNNKRPNGFDIDLATNGVTGFLRASNFVIGFEDGVIAGPTIYDWLNFISTASSGELRFLQNSTLAYNGTTTDFLLKSGTAILGCTGTGASDTVRIGGSYKNFAFGNFYNTGADTFSFSVGGAGGNPARSFRFNHSTVRWEFTDNASDYIPFAQVPMNSQMTKIDSGTLGATAGDYLELGFVTQASSYDALIVVDVITGTNQVYPTTQTYTIAYDYTDEVENAGWREVVPAYSANTGTVALDVRRGTGGRKDLRLRRVTTAAGSSNVNAVIRVVGTETFTASQATGSGATVTGLWRGSAARQENHRLKVESNFSLGSATELTIATGAITKTRSYHRIDTEADAASDDLDTINGGAEGDLLILRAENTARTVVVKDGTGNLKLEGDFSLDNTEDSITLIHNGSNWLETARSNNGA